MKRPSKLLILVYTVSVAFFFPLLLFPQSIKFGDAKSLTMVGKVAPCGEFYHRLDTMRYNDLPAKVKYLATFPAGLAIAFKSNSSSISARWSVKPHNPSPNLSATAFKGLDLYIKQDGKWTFAAVGKPLTNRVIETDFEDTLLKDMDDTEKEYLLYLPLFAEVKNLEIGVDSSATITPIAYPFSKKIVIYGTSIVHGVSASRPGLNYPARLARNTGFNFINLGFSGNAKAEPEVANYLAETDADAYILDFVPNTTSIQIKERTSYLVKTIRNTHKHTPIIVMQSIRMDIGNFNLRIKEELIEKNKCIEQEVRALQKQGIQNLFFIEGESLIGSDNEATSDGIHPNDSGFERMVNHLQPILLNILEKQ